MENIALLLVLDLWYTVSSLIRPGEDPGHLSKLSFR